MKRRGNRRYYQHHEVLMIRRIRDLLYDQGFTISGARNRCRSSCRSSATRKAGECHAEGDALIEAEDPGCPNSKTAVSAEDDGDRCRSLQCGAREAVGDSRAAVVTEWHVVAHAII
jgi:DNA-binding transcriptional MerR regulator